MDGRSRPSWRDADLTPLGLVPFAGDASDTEVLTSGLTQLVSVRSGESYLKWVQLQRIADMCGAAVASAAEDAEWQTSRYLDPHAQLAARIGTALSIGRESAQRLIGRAEALRDRVPNAGILLRDGLITYSAFSQIVAETAAVVDPYLLGQADREIADDIRSSGNVGFYDVRDTARSVVAAIDADAAKTARDKNKPTRGIQIYPAGPGLATLAITNTVENIAKAEAVINHLVETEQVDDDDGAPKPNDAPTQRSA